MRVCVNNHFGCNEYILYIFFILSFGINCKYAYIISVADVKQPCDSTSMAPKHGKRALENTLDNLELPVNI